jgi:hypothetical protein
MQEIFDRTEVLTVLQGFNPWWAGRSAAVPDFRRLAYGACRGILDNVNLPRAILLSGPRRVGKTTLLQQIAAARVAEGQAPRSVL